MIPLHSYPNTSPPAWCAKYIGLPYERGARGPELWDCWGLLMLVENEQFGHHIPPYEGIIWHDHHDDDGRDLTSKTIIAERGLHWNEIEAGMEQPGDAVVLRLYGEPLHVGVVAVPGWMLHASEGADSALERYDGMCWHSRVLGFYRPKEGE